MLTNIRLGTSSEQRKKNVFATFDAKISLVFKNFLLKCSEKAQKWYLESIQIVENINLAVLVSF